MKILLLVTLLLSVLCLSSCQLLKEAPPAAEALRMMAGLVSAYRHTHIYITLSAIVFVLTSICISMLYVCMYVV